MDSIDEKETQKEVEATGAVTVPTVPLMLSGTIGPLSLTAAYAQSSAHIKVDIADKTNVSTVS